MNLVGAAGLLAGFVVPPSPWQEAGAAPASGLSAVGLAIMAVSIGGIFTLVVWCYRKVLGLPRLDEEPGDDSSP